MNVTILLVAQASAVAACVALGAVVACRGGSFRAIPSEARSAAPSRRR